MPRLREGGQAGASRSLTQNLTSSRGALKTKNKTSKEWNSIEKSLA